MKQRALPRLTRRVFLDLALWMTGFGLVVGLAFPPMSLLLGVTTAVALAPRFFLACVGAGLLVGGINFALARGVVGRRMHDLAHSMDSARHHVHTVMNTGSAGSGAPDWLLPVDSDDELGRVAHAFNELVNCVTRAQTIERATSLASTAAARTTAGAGTLAQVAHLVRRADRTGEPAHRPGHAIHRAQCDAVN